MIQPQHFKDISKKVSEIALPIFPHISSKKLKSEILSNLFESQTAIYYNSIGIPTKSTKNDREPDIYFLKDNKPLEIKVTGVDEEIVSSVKWMGGKYSKRTSDYALVMWHYQEEHNTLYGIQKEHLKFAIVSTHIDQEEWKEVDNGNNNYYATVIRSEDILEKDHKMLVGKRLGRNIILEEIDSR